MSAQLEFYIQRAAEARSKADQAVLGNVRDQCLRAAEAWQAMADRVRRTDTLRADRLAATSTEKAA
jgi:hypothetical protein